MLLRTDLLLTLCCLYAVRCAAGSLAAVQFLTQCTADGRAHLGLSGSVCDNLPHLHCKCTVAVPSLVGMTTEQKLSVLTPLLLAGANPAGWAQHKHYQAVRNEFLAGAAAASASFSQLQAALHGP